MKFLVCFFGAVVTVAAMVYEMTKRPLTLDFFGLGLDLPAALVAVGYLVVFAIDGFQKRRLMILIGSFAGYFVFSSYFTIRDTMLSPASATSEPLLLASWGLASFSFLLLVVLSIPVSFPEVSGRAHAIWKRTYWSVVALTLCMILWVALRLVAVRELEADNIRPIRYALQTVGVLIVLVQFTRLALPYTLVSRVERKSGSA